MAKEASPPRRRAVVVMGVSGSGKSSVADGLADALGLGCVDGDDLHSPASVARMKAGTPLRDVDRWPWLDRIGAELADTGRWPQGVVVACSALKRDYRDRIRGAAPSVRFVFLDGPFELIRERIAKRSGHYMAPAMLASQFRTLEVPTAAEVDVVRLSIEPSVDEIVAQAARAVGTSSP